MIYSHTRHTYILRGIFASRNYPEAEILYDKASKFVYVCVCVFICDLLPSVDVLR